MAEKFVIEIVHPIRFLKEYRTFDAPLVTVGRGYHNDLILADPHVAAEHLAIRREESGGWMVESLSRENGMYVRKYAKVVEKALLESGDEIIIGKTRLRLLSPAHPVDSPKLLGPTNQFLKTIGRPVNTSSILIIFLIFFALHVHWTSSENFSALKLAAGALWFLLGALVWAAPWAFVGRMIKHKAQFAAQLSLSALFLMAAVILVSMTEYIGYWTNSLPAEAVSASVFLGTLCAAFLAGNLTVATSVSLKKRVGVSAGISLTVIAVATLLYQTFKDEFNPNPVYYAVLKPPLIQGLPAQSIDQFFAQTQEIFDFSKNTGKGVGLR